MPEPLGSAFSHANYCVQRPASCCREPHSTDYSQDHTTSLLRLHLKIHDFETIFEYNNGMTRQSDTIDCRRRPRLITANMQQHQRSGWRNADENKTREFAYRSGCNSSVCCARHTHAVAQLQIHGECPRYWRGRFLVEIAQLLNPHRWRPPAPVCRIQDAAVLTTQLPISSLRRVISFYRRVVALPHERFGMTGNAELQRLFYLATYWCRATKRNGRL